MRAMHLCVWTADSAAGRVVNAIACAPMLPRLSTMLTRPIPCVITTPLGCRHSTMGTFLLPLSQDFPFALKTVSARCGTIAVYGHVHAEAGGFGDR